MRSTAGTPPKSTLRGSSTAGSLLARSVSSRSGRPSTAKNFSTARGLPLSPRVDDGEERLVDVSDMLWGTTDEPLRDADYFRLVRVEPELGTVVWPNGLDLDPDV